MNWTNTRRADGSTAPDDKRARLLGGAVRLYAYPPLLLPPPARRKLFGIFPLKRDGDDEIAPPRPDVPFAYEIRFDPIEGYAATLEEAAERAEAALLEFIVRLRGEVKHD